MATTDDMYNKLADIGASVPELKSITTLDDLKKAEYALKCAGRAIMMRGQDIQFNRLKEQRRQFNVLHPTVKP
jgi:hypothetical protein